MRPSGSADHRRTIAVTNPMTTGDEMRNMWGERGTLLRLAVDGGRVGCPREGDTDVETCLACGYLDDVDDADQPRLVACRWRATEPARVLDLFDRRWRVVG